MSPRQIMSSMHRKTHFNAAHSIMDDDATCLQLEKGSYYDTFRAVCKGLRRHKKNDAEKRTISQIGHRNTLPMRASLDIQSPVVPGIIKDKFKSNMVVKRASSFGVPLR